MKHLFTLLIVISYCSAYSQKVETPAKELSNLEKFDSRSGTIIKKEFVDIGKIRACKLQVYILTDLISKEIRKGVRFEYEYRSSIGSDTKIGVLDNDEIDALISSIKMIISDITPTTPTNYTEVTYKSRGGFEAGSFVSGASKNEWADYLKLEKYDSRSTVFLKSGDLAELLPLLNNAKALL